MALAASDKKFMRLAIACAKRGILAGQAPFGACIADGKGKAAACAHNLVWKDTDITAHAEVSAIRQACRKKRTIDLSGCAIYSTCEPCPMCFSAIHWAGIGRVVYGATIAEAKKCGFGELEISAARMKRMGKSSVEVERGVLREECRALFGLFMETSGKGKLY